MTTPFTARPTLVGHRGLGAGVLDGHHENSLGSFLAAADAGADWVEVDVRRAADDTLVVAHDPAYEDGAFLVDLPGPEVAARGTLLVEDLLAALPDGIGVDLDLKSAMEDAAHPVSRTAQLVAPLAQREQRRRPVAVTSFDPAAVAVVRATVPDVPVGLLTWLEFPVEHAVAAAAHLDVDVLALHAGSLHPNRVQGPEQIRPLGRVVDLLHGAGRQLLVWGPPPEDLPALTEAGADAVCVNDVAAARAALSGGA